MKRSAVRSGAVPRPKAVQRQQSTVSRAWQWPENTCVNLALLTLASVAFFLPIFLHPTQMLWASDIVRAHAEYRQVQWRSFHVWGSFPLWDPTIFGGKSIVGDPLPALLNPFGAAFWLAWSPVLFGFYLWGAATLSSWGMFLYARTKGCNAPGALAAAVVFALSGKTAGHVFAGHVELLSTALGLTWLLWATERLLRHPRWTHATWLGLTLSFVATFGSVQMVYWHMLFLLLYVGVMTSGGAPRAWLSRAIRNELWLAASFLVFAAAAAAWWFPIVRQTLLLSARTGTITSEFSTMASLAPQDLLRFVWPFMDTPLPQAMAGDAQMGFFWETAAYPGIAALALALTTIAMSWRKPEVWRIGILALLSLLLALGSYGLLYPIACSLVPGFNLFRAPGRFLFYANAMVALLAGFAFRERNDEKSPAPLAIVPIVLWQPVFIATVAMGMGKTQPERGLWIPLLVLSALSLVSFLHVSCNASRRIWQISCLAVLIGELLYMWQPHVRTVDAARALPKRSAAAFLAKQDPSGTFRYYDPTGHIEQQDAARYGLETISGYHPGIYGHQLDLYKRIWREDRSSIVELEQHPVQEAACPTLLDLLNVRYVLSTEPISNPETVEVFRTPPAEATPFRYVYKRTTALPRAWLVGRADAPPPGLTVLDALCGLNPREACLVSDRPVTGTAKYQEVRLDQAAPGNIILRFKCEDTGIAVVSDSWHPDWRATDNGKPIEVRRVNHGLLGIPVPAGDHILHVYYYPWDFYVGVAVSSVTCILIFLLAAGAMLKRRFEARALSESWDI